SLAPEVVAHANAGDAVAQEILRRNAQGLAEMVVTVVRKLGLTEPKIALTGGLISNAAFFRRLFLDELASHLPGFKLVTDGLEPVFGAVLLAQTQTPGRGPSSSFLKNLRESSVRWAVA